ncbi:hypothetical protein [Vibrio aestuarianus]|uniref:Uncharacterized protein n=1 Tax=Vibrio aestuarianus TaxID=28171 RepID=A0ABM9FS44_9VIBR|nr:hypothetical protein [Vibrio aestuarianus]MDE1213778.1 hypothetical protein [Vibrio aestuarianus]MDE1217235.1 hypothetical protein [Vibrio aestuarianus]MDE1256975.1 hypothetical protein [Vibrio aestuarianus]MDE1260776.1 hypothetical protein [Vibrio aestuarianus]MDE1267572.1 hypothetical protein [Vibrio aestuarianus]
METTITAVRAATGVPQGYVEHIRELSENGKRVRAAIVSGEMKAPVRRRRQLTDSEAQEEVQVIKTSLGF